MTPRDGSKQSDERRDDGTGSNGDDNLVVVSNRQPYRHEFDGVVGLDAVRSGGGPSSELDTVAADAFIGQSSGNRSDVSDVDEFGTDRREGSFDGGEWDNSAVSVDRPAGGLTAGLDPVMRRVGGTWVAWGDGSADPFVTDESDSLPVPPAALEDEELEDGYTLRRLWLSEQAVESYYYGYSNRVLWPLCHGFTNTIERRAGDARWYQQVNERFVRVVADCAEPGDVIWLQDYHLALAARMLERRLDEVTIGQFWHVPWPNPDTLVEVPDAPSIVDGLLGADLLGFHVPLYVERFLSTVERLVPESSVDRDAQIVTANGTRTRVVAEPMGVDTAAIASRVENANERWPALRESLGIPEETTLLLGVDRLDYIKGIPERLEALEALLEQRPAWRESITFLQKASPSRCEIPAYSEHRDAVRAAVDRINDRFSTSHWQPIHYTETYLERRDLDALYRHADALIVSSLADGMNLVAQEYVAASVDGDGVLILSERAGAHELLGEAAFSVDPTQTAAFAETIGAALETPDTERRRRMRRLRSQVADCDIQYWARSLLSALTGQQRESTTRDAVADSSMLDGPYSNLTD